MPPHSSRWNILEFIHRYKQEHGVSPTLKEIQEQTNFSRGSVQYNLNKLKEEGFVTWRKSKSRTIQILRFPDTSDADWDLSEPLQKGLPVLGEIAAGFYYNPCVAYDKSLNKLSHNSLTEVVNFLDITYPGQKVGDYVLKICGESMIDAGIPNGAYVGIRPAPFKYEPKPGEIVEAWVSGMGATLKRCFHKGSIVVLSSANTDYEPMVFDCNEIEIAIKGIHIFTWQTV